MKTRNDNIASLAKDCFENMLERADAAELERFVRQQLAGDFEPLMRSITEEEQSDR